MTLAYYPGCSLHKSSAEYDVSVRKVLGVLGVEVKEVPDWTCCGSTPAHMMDHLLAQSLAARNLRQAAEVGDELLAPCPSCYQREKNAELEIHASDAFRAEVNEMLDKPYTGRVTVWSLPEYLMKFVGEEKIAGLVKTDLSQLKVVPYYGCLLGRPGELTGESDIEQPMMMDLLLQAAGVGRQVVELQDRVLRRQRGHAQDGDPAAAERQDHRAGPGRRRGSHRGGCPLCHVNLDLKQAPDQQATSAPTTRCPSCICRRCWVWLSA